MPVRTAYDPTAGEILTATNLERLAGGWIGYAEVTANQTGITTAVDLTGLTVSVTVGPSRRIRIVADLTMSSNAASDIARVTIQEGATVLQTRDVTLGGVGAGATLPASVVLTPSAGAHTYKLVGARASGTGSLTLNAQPTQPALILVQDIGPAT